MRMSELIGAEVRDAESEQVGTVVDVRLHLASEGPDKRPELFGLVVSPHTRSSYLGYERSEARSPALLAALLRWRHRGTFLTLWEDISSLGTSVTLRRGYRRYDAVLRNPE